MGEFEEAADIISSLTRKVIAEEGHHSSGNPESEIAERACYRAGLGLGSDLKETIEAAKKQDLRATIVGLADVAKKAGLLEACGLELNNAPLVNAIQAVCPRGWGVVEEQLKVFGEQVWDKLYQWSPTA